MLLSSIPSMKSSTSSDVIPCPSNMSTGFEPVKCGDIEAKHFVDLTSMDKHHGLKMMASIKNGSLVLLTGKNKGVLRTVSHKILSKKKHFQLNLKTPSDVKAFTELWIGSDGDLHACYTTSAGGDEEYHATVNISGQFIDDSLQKRFEVKINKKPEESFVPTMILKDGNRVTVTRSDTKQEYYVDDQDGNRALLNLKGLNLSQHENIQHIKPCGAHLQVTIKDNQSRQKIRYLDGRHLTLSGNTQLLSPIVSDEPPIGFAHFSVNNSGHFSNANPFVGRKYKHIGNQYIPLSGWVDGIKHRYTSGRHKLQQGRNTDAYLSFLKMADPGLQTAGLWVKDRVSKNLTPAHALLSLKSNIYKEFASLRRFQAEWNWELENHNEATNRAKTDFRLRRTLKNEVLPNVDARFGIDQLDACLEERLTKQLDVCFTALSRLSSGFKSEQGSYDEKLKQRLITFQKRIANIKSHHSFENMPSQDKVLEMETWLNTLIDARATPLKEKDLDLYLAFIERTLVNTRLYLAMSGNQVTEIKHLHITKSSVQYKMKLTQKLDVENNAQLFQSVTQNIASLKSVKQVTQARASLGKSAQDTKCGIGKILNTCMGSNHPAEQITTQLATRTSALPKGDSLTLTAEHGISGFAGIAHFGLPYPLGKGWFAGVVANYEKHYDCKLVALGDGKTQVQFVRKREKGATVMAGTGAGLEDLTKLVKYQNGSLVTIMPFEATLAMTAMKDSEQSFSFDVDNENLKETLSYMFGTPDWKQGFEEQLSKTQFVSREKQKVQLGVSANSEVRLQLGIDASPNFSLVAPRTYAKAGVTIAVSREDVREMKLGKENSASQRRDYEKGVEAELSSGANVMLFPLPAPYALPTAIDEKTFMSIKPFGDVLKSAQTKKYHTTQSVQDKVMSEEWKARGYQEEGLEEVIQGYKKLMDKSSWLPEVRTLVSNQLEILLNALETEGHDVVKPIAAENIPYLKVNYDEKIQWRSRWADNMRRMFHMAPKHSTYLKKIMEPYSGGSQLMRELRASAQSQSQMLNVNKSSSVTALAKYHMPIVTLLKLYQQTLERLDTAQDSKKVLKELQLLDQQLKRKGERARHYYRLDKIECTRESALTRHPSGILPMIQVKNRCQVTLTESLGEIKFIHKEDGMDIKNNMDVSIWTVPE